MTLWLGLVVATGGLDDGGALAAIRGAYEQQRRCWSTLVEYEEKMEPTISDEVARSVAKIIAYVHQTNLFVSSRGKLYYRIRDRRSPLLMAQEKILHIPERIIVFDGSVIRERRPGASADDSLMFVKHRTLWTLAYFGPLYVSATCQALNVDHGPAVEGMYFHQLPEMLDVKPFRVISEREMVDGRPHVLIEAEGWQRLWFDPSKGYAIRRREFWPDNSLPRRSEHTDFQFVAQGAPWLPRRIESLSLGPADGPPEYRGKPVLRTTLTATRLEANRPEHEKYFAERAAPGTLVIDQTAKPVDAAGNEIEFRSPGEGINYRVPAKESDLSAAIEEGKKQRGRDIAVRDRQWFLIGALVAGNVLLLVGALALFQFRRARKGRSA